MKLFLNKHKQTIENENTIKNDTQIKLISIFKKNKKSESEIYYIQQILNKIDFFSKIFSSIQQNLNKFSKS